VASQASCFRKTYDSTNQRFLAVSLKLAVDHGVFLFQFGREPDQSFKRGFVLQGLVGTLVIDSSEVAALLKK